MLMGSVTAFRGIFAGQILGDTTDNSRSGRLGRRIRSWFRSSQRQRGLEPIGSDSGEAQAPAIVDDSLSRATLKGLRTFIRRYNREPGNTTVDSRISEMSYNPQDEYHNFQRQQGGGQAHSLREWPA